jgi:hypothetical protein
MFGSLNSKQVVRNHSQTFPALELLKSIGGGALRIVSTPPSMASEKIL